MSLSIPDCQKCPLGLGREWRAECQAGRPLPLLVHGRQYRVLLCPDCHRVRWKDTAQHSHQSQEGLKKQLLLSLGKSEPRAVSFSPNWPWDELFVNLDSSHPPGRVPFTAQGP